MRTWISMRFPLQLLTAAFSLSSAALLSAQGATTRSPITLDEFFNTTTIVGARLAPDGSSAVIGTENPDWKANNFRHTLWLWTARDGLRALTQSGSDEDAQWSPDGRWIAFLSDRPIVGEAPGESGKDSGDSSDNGDAKRSRTARTKASGEDDKTTRLWLIPVTGGEAQPLFRDKLEVHAFAWAPDGKTIYFSSTSPRTHDEDDKLKDEWKDVIRWREQERGDLLLAMPVAASLAKSAAVAPPSADGLQKEKADAAKLPLPTGAQTVATSKLEIAEIAPSPDGATIAYLTTAVSHRMETPAETEIFLASPHGGEARQLTHNQALEAGLRWSKDGQWLHFGVHAAGGSLEGKYQDVEGRLYRMNPADGKIERLGTEFPGSFDDFDFLSDGTLVALGLKGTEQQIYRVDGQKVEKLPGLAGSYAGLSAAKTGGGLLLRYSTFTQPTQVYLAADGRNPAEAKALSAFNPVFNQRAQPEWKSYTWKAPDGTSVEGMLIFPPGQKDAKHLRMLTLIHGGPADADGNRFEADWYDWAWLAATDGWLVFRPNYRGSSGYGDKFMLEIAPHLVSKPGEDILAGVDALVKDGYADPDKLAVGGYSYGGYMTNWLITATTRFKVAVTGAGAVEHAANWGNDDVTFDDAWYLNGMPWETPELYQSEAALFRMNKVKTPTHIVQGNSDIRVSYLEGVTLERALQQLNVPHSFLVFPGEGHGLGKNPWHGYIKVREELKWLNQYIPK
ncbi:MAG TPA: prolyl oligopeptidase family serine peptidase [Acidobacteriaceae bacterium]|nr:prolyl oligopeptidase family serine peptidase [Acidobacteriaceae bacterium]